MHLVLDIVIALIVIVLTWVVLTYFRLPRIITIIATVLVAIAAISWATGSY